MKYFLALAFLLTGCSSPRFITNLPYKTFFIKRSVSLSECPNGTGGMAIDIYTDMDRSGTFSGGDNYDNSLIACNGVNGTDGLNTLGSVSNYDFTSGVCQEVLSGKIWANKLMNNSGSVRLYDGPACSGNIKSTLKDDKDEVYFSSDYDTLFVVEGLKLSVVKF